MSDAPKNHHPTEPVRCVYCGTQFNQDTTVDEAHFLKLHERVCMRKSTDDRAFYADHRRWPRHVETEPAESIEEAIIEEAEK